MSWIRGQEDAPYLHVNSKLGLQHKAPLAAASYQSIYEFTVTQAQPMV